ncbi:gamma-glutamyltransferase [Lutibacter holmesii]|uniref:Glutathione hydrolase proenzyme n=1 Tax=Lutibacter holmesii TaxID=1137985 RepID=A0ABW3WPZ3_9FLAO
MKQLVLLFFIGLLAIQCTKTNQKKEPVTGTVAENAMVVSARKEASNIGIEILKKGGNAFDAMIATELSLAVAYPFAGNIGGGGFMVFRTNNGETGALDYREKAPLAASKNMYLDEQDNIIPGKSTLGAMAIGVPGTIDGLFKVHEKFGSLPFSELIQPAIDLAYKGVAVTKKQENRLNKYRHYFLEVNKSPIIFDKHWKENDTIKYLALAKTLERIRDNGRDGFYKGETAEQLVKTVKILGGIITKEDLEKYKAIWRKPIEFTYKNLKIIAMSPPSSGGVCSAQIFKALEPFNIASLGHNSLKAIQLITEAERRAYADRSFYLGDPDFVKIPIDTLISTTYVSKRMANFSWEKATSSKDINHGNIIGYESDETTHYSIIDQFGNAISATTTLNGAYGSKVFVTEGGFLLNNEMDDFSSKPGEPNMFGLIGAEANSIKPEKRMLSSMTPTIVEKDNKLFMSLGSPGGSTIITSVMQTILNVYEFNLSMQEAVNAPRFHHQWLPDVITLEPKGFAKDLVLQLQEKGYQINQENSRIIGKVDAIKVLENGKLEGGADYRGDDAAVGY